MQSHKKFSVTEPLLAYLFSKLFSHFEQLVLLTAFTIYPTAAKPKKVIR